MAALSVWILGGCGKSPEKSPYRWGVADRGDVETIVTATGTADAVTMVEVGSQVSAIIKEIFVDFNSPVKKGQVIARLDPTFLQAAVSENEAALAKAEATLAQANRDLERITDLFGKSLAAQVDYDNALTAVDVAKASVQQARAALERARVNLAYSVITSPIDGVVVSRSVDVGQTVAASLSAPTLFTIAQDLRQMQIETNIDEADIGGLREGMAAEFTVDSYPDERFRGTIRQIRYAATVDQNVVTYPVIIDVDNPDLKLRPGMTANVTIVTASSKNVLRVPATALRFRPASASGAKKAEGKRPAGDARDSTGVKGEVQAPPSTIFMKAAGGGLEPRTAQIGLNNGTYAEVLTGEIREGDSLAVGTLTATASNTTTAMPGMGPGGPPRR
ncbi:MAG: efflux RND transporter periplasmic adaptor subunit [bacterium]|nr:efflux RND transporter periplasmic adaptor subunit [bacterium]